MSLMIERPPLLETRTSSTSERRPESLHFSPMMIVVVGAAAATSVAFGITSIPPIVEPQRTAITSSLVGSSAPARAATLSTDGLVRRVRESAGLTWDQIARLFGVSRRSVHHWAVGENMSAHNLEQLGRLDRLVQHIPGESPEEKRAALFAADENGFTPVDAFRQMVATSGVIVNPRSATQASLLGAE